MESDAYEFYGTEWSFYTDSVARFWKPTRQLAKEERDRRNRIIGYKKSGKPITKEQFADLRDGDIYYFENNLGEILAKNFCNSKGFNGPTDEALISDKYGPIYWRKEDFAINLSIQKIKQSFGEKSKKPQDCSSVYEKTFNATPEELGKAAMLIALSSQKVNRGKIIEYCDFLKEELKKYLLEIAVDIDVDLDKIEDIRGLIFTLDDIKETLTKTK